MRTFAAIKIRWQRTEQRATRASYRVKRADPENSRWTMKSETKYLWNMESRSDKHNETIAVLAATKAKRRVETNCAEGESAANRNSSFLSDAVWLVDEASKYFPWTSWKTRSWKRSEIVIQSRVEGSSTNVFATRSPEHKVGLLPEEIFHWSGIFQRQAWAGGKFLRRFSISLSGSVAHDNDSYRFFYFWGKFIDQNFSDVLEWNSWVVRCKFKNYFRPKVFFSADSWVVIIITPIIKSPFSAWPWKTIL